MKAVPEGAYGFASNRRGTSDNSYRKNTYKGLRLAADDYNLYYAVWCTNETEFYNLKVSTPP
jgi:N-acetylglucosamine-6-sulfatase